MTGMAERPRISGKDATNLALEGSKRGPVRLEPSGDAGGDIISLPSPTGTAEMGLGQRKPPPRVRKPSPTNDRCLAPASDLEAHRARLREAFGNTMSDEFVEVMLGQLIQALRPSPFDQLEEATLNAALALVCSVRPCSEFEAQMAIQIVAVGFAGMRFLRQSQRQMTEDYIDVYGTYAIKLLKLQNDLIHTLDRHRRGNTQTVEIRHVHVHAGGQAAVGIINPSKPEGGSQNE
jgi:hypothetical protein